MNFGTANYIFIFEVSVWEKGILVWVNWHLANWLQYLACEQANGKDGKKNLASAKQGFEERSNLGRTGEPVEFKFDVPINAWRLACNKSVNEGFTPVKELVHFLYWQTVLIDLIKQLGPACPSRAHTSLESLGHILQYWNEPKEIICTCLELPRSIKRDKDNSGKSRNHAFDLWK